jgi:curved DNA-binding protein CbpA
MSGLLTVDRQLGRLLVEAARRGDSGIVTCVRGKLKRLFCLDAGSVAMAVSNVVEEQIGHRLLQEKLLRPPDLQAVQQACAKQKELKLSRFLVEFGTLSQETMERVAVEQIRELLHATLDWTDGECAFERGMPDLQGELAVRASSAEMLLDYASSRPASLDAARMRIGPPNLRLVPTQQAEQVLSEISSDSPLLSLTGQCDGERTLAQLVAESPHDPDRTWRGIYALVLAGALEPQRTAGEAGAVARTVTREEMLARVERAVGADHYSVLGLTSTATTEEVRDAYYFLARRYHPDRFRAGALEKMMEQIEHYFAQVTEAYNTLSDPEKRKAYEEERTADSAPRSETQDTHELARQNYLFARTLIARGRLTDAVTSLENAIELDDGQAIYYLELGRLQARNPRYRQEAERNLLRCNELDPTKVDGYLVLGQLYARTKREEEAARLFREVLRWEPGHVEAAEKLEELGQKSSSEGGGLRGLFRG